MPEKKGSRELRMYALTPLMLMFLSANSMNKHVTLDSIHEHELDAVNDLEMIRRACPSTSKTAQSWIPILCRQRETCMFA